MQVSQSKLHKVWSSKVSMVRSINFAILGAQEIASKFGKKGTVTDLALFDRKDADSIRTWVAPCGFPDKIQPLLQAINLAEYVIFHVGSLDRFAGEQIVALDALKKHKGILSHTFEVDESRLEAMIKGTIVEGYARANLDEIKVEMDKLEPITSEGQPEVLIDHCFDVKGVGTVVLGKVANGKIKQYDTLKLYPAGTDVMIKSIQMHGDQATEAAAPARVGLALKGIKPDEIGRGDVIAIEGAVCIESEIELDFVKSPFYKGEIAVNQGCLVNVGLQVKAARFTSISPILLTFERPIVCKKGQIAVILKPESPTIRILGSGSIQ